MITTCAHPTCNALFRYLRSGEYLLAMQKMWACPSQDRVLLAVRELLVGHAPDAEHGRNSGVCKPPGPADPHVTLKIAL
jgi:hypothetical protein